MCTDYCTDLNLGTIIHFLTWWRYLPGIINSERCFLIAERCFLIAEGCFPGDERCFPHSEHWFPRTGHCLPGTECCFPMTERCFPTPEHCFPRAERCFPRTERIVESLVRYKLSYYVFRGRGHWHAKSTFHLSMRRHYFFLLKLCT